MNPKHKEWSVEEEQQLIDLKCENKGYLEIAEIMGRTPDSLRKKHFLLMKEYGTPKFWEKIKELEELGYFEEGKEEVRERQDVTEEVKLVRKIEKLKGNSGHLLYLLLVVQFIIIAILLVKLF